MKATIVLNVFLHSKNKLYYAFDIFVDVLEVYILNKLILV